MPTSSVVTAPAQTASPTPLPWPVRAGLVAAIAVPFIYFGTQLVAAPFYPSPPGYSFVRDAASLLGSDLASHPAIFNTGAILTGALMLAAAPATALALTRRGAHWALAWLPAISIAVNGFIAVKAGMYPLPDQRHGGQPGLMIAVLLLPVLLAAAVWRLPRSRGLLWYLIATALLTGAMVPVMAGAMGIDRGAYEGLLQRAATLLMFPPIAVAGWWLRR